MWQVHHSYMEAIQADLQDYSKPSKLLRILEELWIKNSESILQGQLLQIFWGLRSVRHTKIFQMFGIILWDSAQQNSKTAREQEQHRLQNSLLQLNGQDSDNGPFPTSTVSLCREQTLLKIPKQQREYILRTLVFKSRSRRQQSGEFSEQRIRCNTLHIQPAKCLQRSHSRGCWPWVFELQTSPKAQNTH